MAEDRRERPRSEDLDRLQILRIVGRPVLGARFPSAPPPRWSSSGFGSRHSIGLTHGEPFVPGLDVTTTVGPVFPGLAVQHLVDVLGEALPDEPAFPLTITIDRSEVQMRVMDRARPVTVYRSGDVWVGDLRLDDRQVTLRGWSVEPGDVELVEVNPSALVEMARD